MTPHKPPHKYKFLTPHYIFPILLLLIFLGIGSLLYVLTPLSSVVRSFLTPNYAEQVAKPIEEALAEDNGAKKLCSNGNNGRGIDNQTPWYGSAYEINLSEIQSIELMQKIASLNGYRLVHASLQDKGPVSTVADGLIDKWYFDTSKRSSHTDLKPGAIELSLAIYGENEKRSCDGTLIKKGQSNITINVELPEYK